MGPAGGGKCLCKRCSFCPYMGGSPSLLPCSHGRCVALGRGPLGASLYLGVCFSHLFFELLSKRSSEFSSLAGKRCLTSQHPQERAVLVFTKGWDRESHRAGTDCTPHDILPPVSCMFRFGLERKLQL